MLIIGLTGPTGAGKGLISAICGEMGIPSIDTDMVYHRLLLPPSPCLDELVARFGRDILAEDGQLNRPALAHRVFTLGDAQDHADLNRITHRYVIERTLALCRTLADAGAPAVLVDAPLLIESGLDRACDKIIAVLAPSDVRLARIMARDSLTQASALERLKAQQPDTFYSDRADAVIINDGDPDAPRAMLTAWLRTWGVVSG